MKLVNEEQKLYLNSSIGSLAMEGFSVTEKEKKLAEILEEDNKKKEKTSHSVTNSENSSIHSSNKKKNDSVKNKLNINLINYKKNRDLKNNECESVEEVHFLLIKTIHNGRKMIINMDRKNK